MASVSSCENLPPYLINPVPAGSKTDPLLAKAKPISNGGSAPVITYLKGEELLAWVTETLYQCDPNMSMIVHLY